LRWDKAQHATNLVINTKWQKGGNKKSGMDGILAQGKKQAGFKELFAC